MIKMYSAIDREVANTIVESINETVEEVNKWLNQTEQLIA